MASKKPDNLQDAMKHLSEMIHLKLQNTHETFAAKDLVRQMLGSIMAALKGGISFGDLAEMFRIIGFPVTEGTLRRYFYTMKLEQNLAKKAKKTAAQILKANSVQKNKHVLPLLGESTISVAEAENNGNTNFENANLPELLSKPVIDKNKLQKHAIPAPTIFGSNVSGEFIFDDIQPVRAWTVDEIEKASEATEKRSPITEDLKVVNGMVFTASGKPFAGTLTRKQIFVLRQTGKIVAQTMIGSTTKDFVEMRSKL